MCSIGHYSNAGFLGFVDGYGNTPSQAECVSTNKKHRHHLEFNAIPRTFRQINILTNYYYEFPQFWGDIIFLSIRICSLSIPLCELLYIGKCGR